MSEIEEAEMFVCDAKRPPSYLFSLLMTNYSYSMQEKTALTIEA